MIKYFKKYFIAILVVFSLNYVIAQKSLKLDINAYIDHYSDVAIRHMVEYGIPASITLSQGILESAAGTSELALQANNHFGIKCHDWKGETYTYDDDVKGECFRKYSDPKDSYEDHAKFLMNRPRYAKLFTLDIMDYTAWAKELKAAGYATLTTYAEKLISYIEKYRLFKYDSVAYEIINLKNKQSEISPKRQLKIEISKEDDKIRIKETQKAETRKVEMVNGLSCIRVRKGDTKESLASEFGLAEWQIRRYNELGFHEELTAGSIIYLQPKHDSHPELEVFITQKEESWKSLSYALGMRESALKGLNNGILEPIPPGTKIFLRNIDTQ